MSYIYHKFREIFQELCEVQGRGVSIDGGVGGQDDLSYAVLTQALEQGSDAQSVGRHPIEWGERAVEDVVAPFKLTASFKGEHVLGLFNDAERVLISRTPTDRARARPREVAADLTLLNPLFKLVKS